VDGAEKVVALVVWMLLVRYYNDVFEFVTAMYKILLLSFLGARCICGRH